MMRVEIVMLAIFLVSGLPAGADERSAPQSGARVGQMAPDFSLRDQEGNLVRLSELAYPGEEKAWKKKRGVLVDFFRTDCEPCLKELPQVIAYHQKNHERVRVIMIALLESENGREKLDAFMNKHRLPFPVLVDAYEVVAKKYILDGETVTLPSIFYINKNGKIRARFVGLKLDLESSLKKTLAGK